MGFACDRKYLDISKETFGQGLESGLLYISLTEAGESLARLSVNAPIFDGPHENEMLKNKALCEMLLDGIDDTLYAKLRANEAIIQDICFTFVVSEHQPSGLKMLVGPLLKGYVSFYCPYPSDEKTFKRFLDSNGISPRNYSEAELASIRHHRGYEKPSIPNVTPIPNRGFKIAFTSRRQYNIFRIVMAIIFIGGIIAGLLLYYYGR